jgi:exosortase/archaeosortase family protein
VFLGTLLVLVVLYAVFYNSGPMVTLSEVTAGASGWLLNLFGQSVSVQGTNLTSTQLNLQIIPECTAASSFAIYLAAIVAYPAQLSAKGRGILIGVFGLFLLNLVRIASLYAVGGTFPEYLDFAHLVVWQSVMVILTIVLWMSWTRHVAIHTAN